MSTLHDRLERWEKAYLLMKIITGALFIAAIILSAIIISTQ